MLFSFYKYQGAGNDFIMIDNRNLFFPKQEIEFIKRLCNRNFGIGADGLVLLEAHNEQEVDFQMIYFNSDGKEGTMCGNAGRCIALFAHQLGIIKNKAVFRAIDGSHQVELISEDISDQSGIIRLRISDVSFIQINDQYSFLNTGSPHHVERVENLKDFDVFEEGKKIRFSPLYPQGANINFIEKIDENQIFVRTYERGVENETLACGTGVTASALDYAERNCLIDASVDIITLGGNLKVYWRKENRIYKDIYLEGPAKFVFKGEMQMNK